ncbi:hypothetical protein EVAR_18164_1 [Eumeta japonica]|uniref:Uncharacterized protein n=1 Tax=Eumeta variegata TaxID=151549 RepID=A0A4C1UVA2_EUMVA|nr:hypothetical protein EVAR_18164_1 [Eumeta japonica]
MARRPLGGARRGGQGGGRPPSCNLNIVNRGRAHARGRAIETNALFDLRSGSRSKQNELGESHRTTSGNNARFTYRSRRNIGLSRCYHFAESRRVRRRPVGAFELRAAPPQS